MIITSPARVHRIDAVLWLAAFASAGLTLWLSLGPVPPGTAAFPHADKVEHFIAYFVTSLLLFLAAWWRPGRGAGPLYRWRWWLVGLVVVSGGAVEIAQSVVTADRKAEWLDWFTEIVAVLLAAWIVVQTEWSGRAKSAHAEALKG